MSCSCERQFLLAHRDTAALLCALMASSSIPGRPWECSIDFGTACDAIGVETHSYTGAAELARQALWATPETLLTGDAHRERWAEAESLLRCGWTP